MENGPITYSKSNFVDFFGYLKNQQSSDFEHCRTTLDPTVVGWIGCSAWPISSNAFDQILVRFMFGRLEPTEEALQATILTGSKIPLGFGRSRLIKKYVWSPIFDSALQFWEMWFLLSKNFAKIQLPTGFTEVQAGIECRMTPESSQRFYLVSNKQ